MVTLVRLIPCLLLLLSMTATAADERLQALDRETVTILDKVATGDFDAARRHAKTLASRYPNYALAQLLQAELAAVDALDGARAASSSPWSPALLELLLEARARWAAHDAASRTAPLSGSAAPQSGTAALRDVPAPFLQLGSAVEQIVLVDVEHSMLSLYSVKAMRARRVRQHYVSAGSAGYGKRLEGDRKTPLGLYRIVGRLEDPSLPELYGTGALVLDYPNSLDRALGRTGSGIWLHGIPRARASRAPRSSEGCVTMSNAHLDALYSQVEPAATLVLLTAGPTESTMNREATLREAHRLFARYKDGAERDAVTWSELDAEQRRALAGVTRDDVTILLSDAVTGSFDNPVLTMDITLDIETASHLTLYWARTPDGSWILAHESLAMLDT